MQDTRTFLASVFLVSLAYLITTTALLAEDGNRRVIPGSKPTSANAPAPAPKPTPKPLIPVLPPLPDGVVDLKFSDFYKLPVGRFGLEPTEKLKSLEGKRVRICGYMVHEEIEKGEEQDSGIIPGLFMATELPCSVNGSHYGQCDDLPPQVVYVSLPKAEKKIVEHVPGPILMIGTLNLGNQTLSNGRVAHVRLTLEKSFTTVKLKKATDSSGEPDSPKKKSVKT